MWLSNNHITGTIPAALGNLTELQLWNDVDDVVLRKRVVGWWHGAISLFRHLDFTNNSLSGSIPASICGLISVQ